MEHTASNLAAELKRQIISKLPPRPLVGGGFHHFELKASVKAEVSPKVALDALSTLLMELRAECPEWGVELDGGHDNLRATFTR